MGKKTRDPLGEVSFHCKGCGHRFKAAPVVEDAPERDHHPFSYWQECPECGDRAEQASWEQNLLKAYANSTGPRTPEGKAASAANLEGHPTQEEALRTRFNAMKHGLAARTATYFPAKPGGYPACDGCEYLESKACLDGPRACLKRTELFMRHQVAFDTNDPTLLSGVRADTQAAIQALINDMILAIAQDGGPRIHEVSWYHDKEGEFHLASYLDEDGKVHQITEIKAHPLLKHLMDFIAKNSMTLADLEMTPKVRNESEMMQGYLDKKDGQQESVNDFQQRMDEGVNKLMRLVDNSYKREAATVDGEVIEDADPAEASGNA